MRGTSCADSDSNVKASPVKDTSELLPIWDHERRKFASRQGTGVLTALSSSRTLLQVWNGSTYATRASWFLANRIDKDPRANKEANVTWPMFLSRRHAQVLLRCADSRHPPGSRPSHSVDMVATLMSRRRQTPNVSAPQLAWTSSYTWKSPRESSTLRSYWTFRRFLLRCCPQPRLQFLPRKLDNFDLKWFGCNAGCLILQQGEPSRSNKNTRSSKKG